MKTDTIFLAALMGVIAGLLYSVITHLRTIISLLVVING